MKPISGTGTLIDGDEIEIATVGYRIDKLSDDGADWAGSILVDPEMGSISAGRYDLVLEDGTRLTIRLEPEGSGGGDEVEFTGVGLFGRSIEP